MKQQIKIKGTLQKYSTIIILLAMIMLSAILSSTFLTTTNIMNVLKQVSVVTILSFAQCMIIITGEIDLSLGTVAGMAGSYAVILYVATGSLVLSFGFGMILGALVGLINGLFIAYFKLPSFIVTLAMQSITFGAITLYTKGNNIYRIGDFKIFGQKELFGFLPITIFFIILMCIIMIILLRYTKFGRYLYAVGSNSESAVAAGIQVTKVKWVAFIISGIFAAIGGMVLMGRLNAGIPSEGQGYETDAIMATVVGGTSFSGGVGTATGTLVGSLIIGVLNNIMNLLGVEAYTQRIIKGFLIIIAVLFDVRSKQKKSTIKIMSK
ncbi:MAG: ABC transporter permease [Clostridiaceae bacterium]|nr:ABC transporter permease [Clostridiaceae bacterium]